MGFFVVLVPPGLHVEIWHITTKQQTQQNNDNHAASTSKCCSVAISARQHVSCNSSSIIINSLEVATKCR